MNAVDELVLHTLERFTGRGTDDAPFEEKWRTAVLWLEHDLATGPVRTDEADALDTPGMSDRLRAVTDRWRALLRDALAAEDGELGLDRGHAGLLSAMDTWLTSWETT
jgi:hypothetical protein